MLPRHRRRYYSPGEQVLRRPRVFIRALSALILLFIVWTVISRILGYFGDSMNRKAGVTLLLKGAEGVSVALQSEEWQRAESNLKLYAGDAVRTGAGSEAILSYFDGSSMRLDGGTEISIERSDRLQDGTSTLSATMDEGRLWIRTPSHTAYTGAALRTVSAPHFSLILPSGSQVLLTEESVTVLEAEGLGVSVALTFDGGGDAEIMIGEGQTLSLDATARTAVKSGKDPYDFRDPTPKRILESDFVIASLNAQNSTAVRGTSLDGGVNETSDAVLSIQTPKHQEKVNGKAVAVKGKTNEKVVDVFINGQSVVLQKDRTFSTDVAIPFGVTTSINIEARNAQGVTLARETRIVESIYAPSVDPVKIKSPVGSGETLKTNLPEIEITGDAPSGTEGIVVNDYRLHLFKSGSKTWSYLASVNLGNMKSGTNVFTVVAVNADGAKSPPRSITIEYSPQETPASSSGSTSTTPPPLKQNPPLSPGSLSVTAPQTGTEATVSESEILLEGTVSPDTASISVNGYTLGLYAAGKTTWNYIASTTLQTMKRGKNIYRIVARNTDGEILDVVEYTVTYKP